MVRFTAIAMLLGLVSCQQYPKYKKTPNLTPGLQLLTGGVSEFIVDGRTYGTDLPPLLTGQASFQEFEESRLRRQRKIDEQLFGGGLFDIRGGIGFSRSFGIYPDNQRHLKFGNDIGDIHRRGLQTDHGYDGFRESIIPWNNLIHGDDLVSFGRPKDASYFPRDLFQSGSRKIHSKWYRPTKNTDFTFNVDLPRGNVWASTRANGILT